MALQFKPPFEIQQAKRPLQALNETLGPALQSLPTSYEDYQLNKKKLSLEHAKLDQELAQLRGQYGSSVADLSGLPGTQPTTTDLSAMNDAQKLSAFGTQGVTALAKQPDQFLYFNQNGETPSEQWSPVQKEGYLPIPVKSALAHQTITTPGTSYIEHPDGTVEVRTTAPGEKQFGFRGTLPGGGPEGQRTKQQQKDDDYYFKITNAINSDTKARAAIGINQQKLNSIGSAKAAIDQVASQPGGADTRQMFEIAAATVRPLLGNNVLTEGEINQMIPSTFKGNLNKFIEKVTNEPQGLDAQNFVQRFRETLGREFDVTNGQIEESRKRWFGQYDNWLRSHPEYGKELYTSLNLKHDLFNPNPTPVVNPFGNQQQGVATHRWNPQTGKVEAIQ